MDRVNLNGAGNLEQLQARKTGESDRANQFQTTQNAGTNALQRDADEITVSSRANEISQTVEKISDLPPIRQERVNALRAQALSGNYRPDAKQIADAILRENR
jgi:negative regulator of flagellin synthesis FlgM